MIRRMRNSRAARAALCVAALCALVAAFGLHPEPADPCSAIGQRFAQTALHTAPTHDCVACLHAGSALVARMIRLVLSTASAPAVRPASYDAPSADLPAGLAGRSPPAA
jgi:hypothetical protein